MQQREGFSARTLALSTAAAELGRVILREGQSGSVRAALLGNVLATAALVLLAVFVSWNAARLRRPGFVGNCCCAAFLFWYLWELVRTAAMIQQVCWEQFSSMAFFGLLPLLLWAGWSLGCELYDRMAAVLGAFVVLGSLFCLLGLAGQLEWQHLVMGESGRSFALPDAFFTPNISRSRFFVRVKMLRRPVKNQRCGFRSSLQSFLPAIRWGWHFCLVRRRAIRAMSFCGRGASGASPASMPHSCSSGWRRRSFASVFLSAQRGCSVSGLPGGPRAQRARRLHNEPP